MYAKYLWTHIESDNATVVGDKYHFDSADSHRIRGGLRYAHKVGNFTPYIGAAYEYEFDGEAGGRVWGYDIKETDMGGGTAIGEIGFMYATSENVSASLALEGYTGERDGFGGTFRLNYRF